MFKALIFILLATSSYASEHKQLILVLSKDWSATKAKLYRYEKTEKWVPLGRPIDVVLGKNGLAWGRGIPLENSFVQNGPIKKEGDGKAPAGFFSLGKAFGYGPFKDLKWPYQISSQNSYCVDDSQSKFYNQIVDRTQVKSIDWKSAEVMKRTDGLYKFGVFVNHNTHPTVPDTGSCIFLHIWKSSQEGTAGCTAMAESDLKNLMLWLDPKKDPHLLQLPMSEYLRLKDMLGLPVAPFVQ